MHSGKLFLSLLLLLVLSSCSDNSASKTKAKEIGIPSSQIKQPIFQSILDSAKVEGAILIYDAQKESYYSNDFAWTNKGQLPASTFKIPNSIIALETGIVKNDSTLFKWDGITRSIKNWNQDLIFKEAFQYSCVPCYQKIARQVGVKQMQKMLAKLAYPGMVVDSNSIDRFWLEGAARINQFQQIDFLKRFYDKQLPISDRTQKIVRNMLLMETTDQHQLSGKTGWSIQDDYNNGWFVGYVENENGVYYFATNITPTPALKDIQQFIKIRKSITMEALAAMKIFHD